MDFFRSQRQARRRTLGFLALFVLTVLLVAAFACVLVWFGSYWMTPMERLTYTRDTAFVVIAIIIGASLVRAYDLRDGGAVVARHLGGEPLPTVSSSTSLNAARADHPNLQRLRNIVEEMAIASRTPMPALYWLPNESAINAFVAGFTPADAVLAVTRGTLERLSRDELQGVVAHEFSHLLNGDMRLNTRVACWLFGIYGVHTYGRRILATTLQPDLSRKRLRLGVFWPMTYIFGGALTVIGYAGLLGGRLLQAAIARQREYLADASAVQFTRQTIGLAGALKKIYFDGSLLRSPQAGAYSHFFISEAIEYSALFATHPPLLERIRTLDKNFDPEQDPRADLDASFDADALHRALPLFFQSSSNTIVTATDTAFNMRDGLALLFANLIDSTDSAVEERQFATISADWEHDVAQQARLFARNVRHEAVYLRLTRLRLMLVYLHTLSAAQQALLRQTLQALIAANHNISLLEAAIASLVEHYLRDMVQPAHIRIAGRLRLTQCAQEIALLQKLVQDHPQHTPEQIALDTLDDTLQSPTQHAQALEAALDRLNRLTMDDKKTLIQTLHESCHGATCNQQEILSLIAACLHTPPLDALIHYPGDHLTLAAD